MVLPAVQLDSDPTIRPGEVEVGISVRQAETVALCRDRKLPTADHAKNVGLEVAVAGPVARNAFAKSAVQWRCTTVRRGTEPGDATTQPVQTENPSTQGRVDRSRVAIGR